MSETEDLLAARRKQHGDFTDTAEYIQEMKSLLRSMKNWPHLSFIQHESLEMIVHKIGRIMSGDPNHADHWDDIAGYARLVSQRISPRGLPISAPYVEGVRGRGLAWTKLLPCVDGPLQGETHEVDLKLVDMDFVSIHGHMTGHAGPSYKYRISGKNLIFVEKEQTREEAASR